MTKKLAKNSYKQGFSLLEMILFIAIAGIFTISVLGTLNNFLKAYKNIQMLAELQGSTINIFNELIQEAHWSDDFDIQGSDPIHQLTLVKEGSDDVIFKVQSGQLLKDDLPISSDKVTVNSFVIQDLIQDDTKTDCLNVSIALEYNSSLLSRPSLQDNMTISFRKTKIE